MVGLGEYLLIGANHCVLIAFAADDRDHGFICESRNIRHTEAIPSIIHNQVPHETIVPVITILKDFHSSRSVKSAGNSKISDSNLCIEVEIGIRALSVIVGRVAAVRH